MGCITRAPTDVSCSYPTTWTSVLPEGILQHRSSPTENVASWQIRVRRLATRSADVSTSGFFTTLSRRRGTALICRTSLPIWHRSTRVRTGLASSVLLINAAIMCLAKSITPSLPPIFQSPRLRH